jgi:serine/threonine protein kinase
LTNQYGINERPGRDPWMRILPSINCGTTTLVTQQQEQDGEKTVFLAGGPGIAKDYRPGDLVDTTYLLTNFLGQGGMGVVFSCEHTVLVKKFAIKLLDGELLTELHWDRFKAEAKALARLNHPAIVGIHNMGVDKGQCPYFVMDLLSGETLDALVKRDGRLSPEQALDLFIQVADALSSAHAQGIIHRDVKPSNLMLVKDSAGQIIGIKVVDFGIASVSTLGQSQNQSQTIPGLIFGTPYYMSPEQCQGGKADARSDVYSLGCTIFEALTGSPPFRGDNSFHTYMMHQTAVPPALTSRCPDVTFPDGLEQALERMLAKSADDRYQTMAQVKHNFERIRDGKPIVARGVGDAYANCESDHDANIGQPKSGQFEKVAAIGIVLAVLVGGLFLTAHFARAVNKPIQPSTVVQPSTKDSTPNLDFQGEMGASVEEVDMLMHEGADAEAEERKFKILAKPYLDDPAWMATRFKVTKPLCGFNFPRTFVVGAIQIGAGAPTMATGFIPAPEGSRVCVFLPGVVTDAPGMLDKFGSQDVSALEAVFTKPSAVIPRLAGWTNLTELSFFDSLIKALPSCERWDESDLSDSDLPFIDKLTNLRSLGLCGPKVTGGAVCEMTLLSAIEVLRLKRISDLPTLLKTLPAFDNIKEIWLVGQNITDDQLQYLSRMKNLESITIRRSCLTPASLATFARMPRLRHLRLDRNNWSELEKESFKKAIPGCSFEPVVDGRFWLATPKAN